MEKKYYTTTELKQLGFSDHELDCARHVPGQTYATQRIRGGRWYWDLEKYEAARIRQTRKSKPA